MWCCQRRWSSPRSRPPPTGWPGSARAINWTRTDWNNSPPRFSHTTHNDQKLCPVCGWTLKSINKKVCSMHIILPGYINTASLELECSCSCRIVISYGPKISFLGDLKKNKESVNLWSTSLPPPVGQAQLWSVFFQSREPLSLSGNRRSPRCLCSCNCLPSRRRVSAQRLTIS